MTNGSTTECRGGGNRFLGILSRPLTLPLLTLRCRLLGGAVVLWIALCVILMTLGWQAGYLLVDETNRQHLRYEAELIRNSITYQVNERLEALEHLAQKIPEPTGDALTSQSVHALSPLFEGLLLFDLDSRITDGWPANNDGVGVSFPDREYARFMHATRRPYVSAPFIGRITGQPMVMMLVPLHDETGRYTGFLGGVVNIKESQLFKGFKHLRLGDRGHVTITTASGQRLYHPSQQQAIAELPTDLSPALELALYGWQGETEEISAAGEEALVAYRQVWPSNWIVGVHLPRSQAEAPLVAGMQRISYFALWTLGLVLPVVGALIWLALHPLARLTEQVRELQSKRRHVLDIPTQMPELRRIIDAINATEKARMANLRDLARREAFLRGTLAASPQGMFVTDPSGRLTFVNDTLREILGITAAQSLETWAKQIPLEDRIPMLKAWHHSLAERHNFMHQFRFVDQDDRQRWLDVQTSAIHVEGEFIGIVGSVRDITQHRHDTAQHRWEAEHDPLTGLLNRRGLTRRLEEALIEWKKTGTQAGLLLFDLDHFKPINDHGGHALGDRMLQRVSETVRAMVRGSDHAARQGGDEFAVLLNGCSLDQALIVAKALGKRIASCPVEHQGKLWSVTASIGVDSFQPDDNSIDAILSRADAASYRAKKDGRNCIATCIGTDGRESMNNIS